MTLKNDYKNYVKILDKVIKNAKLIYERDTVIKVSNDPKKLWNLINSQLSEKKKKETKSVCYFRADESLLLFKKR